MDDKPVGPVEDGVSQRLTGRDLIADGWNPGPTLGVALRLAQELEGRGFDRTSVLKRLRNCRTHPRRYVTNSAYEPLARAILADLARDTPAVPQKLGRPKSYPIWGARLIDPEAIAQMDLAMSLPVAVRGALMPDAHIGYGLPIGGVLETKDSVIPYAVGSDIACRMRLTVLDVAATALDQQPENLRTALVEGTVFGAGRESGRRIDSPVLDADWSATPLLRTLRDVASRQLGTSGSGNHFVEWGEVDWLGQASLALMSHSGSRGVGFKIADHYSKLAEDLRRFDLPPEAIRLAWLDLDSEPGREYWLSMELAGQFASENHAAIHGNVLKLAGVVGRELAVIENHHNFAWISRGEERGADRSVSVVHRKGATPAAQGVMGVIPGSMGSPGYVVVGKGNPRALDSASHGAGRAMGRKQAERSLTRDDRDRALARAHVTLIGGGLDEAPQAYKSIEDVMEAQQDLVEIKARFRPRIVRMDRGSRDI